MPFNCLHVVTIALDSCSCCGSWEPWYLLTILMCYKVTHTEGNLSPTKPNQYWKFNWPCWCCIFPDACWTQALFKSFPIFAPGAMCLWAAAAIWQHYLGQGPPAPALSGTGPTRLPCQPVTRLRKTKVMMKEMQIVDGDEGRFSLSSSDRRRSRGGEDLFTLTGCYSQ